MREEIIGVVGLGYVGLPLAVRLSGAFQVVGFDINPRRIEELKAGHDHTHEVDPAMLNPDSLSYTASVEDLTACTFLIVAVPTPVTDAHDPDLTPAIEATKTVGAILGKGMLVSYESTVYPGVTEEVCAPILEAMSGLKLGDFDLAYSPERVNPGDKQHTIDKIVKVVSASSPEALERAAFVYGKVTDAGVHRAPSIKTAEAAKVIENVQRDLNIALMNELSKIFNLMGIHTGDVLEAAGTKWNFHKYHPGLVGGHCIGVDPYYLTYRAVQLGYHPEVILAGRRINDGMGHYVGDMVIRALNAAGRLPRDAKIWLLGLTFKENVPDFRNTRAVDVARYLQGFGCHVVAWEPMVDSETIRKKFGLESVSYDAIQEADAVVLVNGHNAYREIQLADLRQKVRTPVLVDIKNFFPREQAEQLGFIYKSL